MLSITWREYLKREATDVFNILLVALVALTIWAVLWLFTNAYGPHHPWY